MALFDAIRKNQTSSANPTSSAPSSSKQAGGQGKTILPQPTITVNGGFLNGTNSPNSPKVVAKTAYQQNMARPTTNQPKMSEAQSMLSWINSVAATDPNRANELYTAYNYARANERTAPIYDPFASPSNQAVAKLSALGIDTSGGINDEFYQKYGYLKNYYQTTANTNNLSSTMSNKKKASLEEQQAYLFNQLSMAEDKTVKAETQRDALMEEISFLVNDPLRNYSNEEIKSIIKEDFEKKYSVLQEMKDSAKKGLPIELNRPVQGWNDDGIDAMIWMARNPDVKVNYDQALAYIGMGEGLTNAKFNSKVTDARNFNNKETWAPYSFGSTMSETCRYFNKYQFTDQDIEDIRTTIDQYDETAMKHFDSLVSANAFTKDCEAQWKVMQDDIDALLGQYDNADDIWDAIWDGTNDYSALAKLDQSIEDGDLLDTTRAIGYRGKDVKRYIQEVCDAKSKKDPANEIVTSTTGEEIQKTEAEQQLDNYAKEKSDAIVPTVRNQGTEAEMAAATTGKTADFDGAQEKITTAEIPNGVTEKQITDLTVKEMSGFATTQYQYESNQRARDAAQEEYDQITVELKELEAKRDTLSGLTQEQYERLKNIGEWDAWEDVKAELEMGPGETYPDGRPRFMGYDRALDSFYYYVAQNDNVDPQMAKQWLTFLQNESPMNEIMEIVKEDDQTGEYYTGDIISAQYDLPNGQAVNVDFRKEKDGSFTFVGAQNQDTDEEYTEDQLNSAIGFSGKTDFTDEDNARIGILTDRQKELEEKIVSCDLYAEENEKAYNEAAQHIEYLTNAYMKAARLSGGKMDTGLISSIRNCVALGLEPPETPQYLPDSVFDIAVQEGSLTEEEAINNAASTAVNSLASVTQIQGWLDSLQKSGVKLDEGQMANINARLKILKDNAYSAAVVALDGSEDFRETVDGALQTIRDAKEFTVDSGEYAYLAYAIATIDQYNPAGASGMLGEAGAITDARQLARQMTQKERDRYIYIREKDGWLAARNYMENLTSEFGGALAVRRNQQMFENARSLASQNGWSAAFATGVSFGTKVIGGVNDILQFADTKINGTPYGPFSKKGDMTLATNAMRQGAKEYFMSLAGDNKDLANGLGLLYGAFTSAVDSRINARMMNGLFKLVSNGFGKFTSYMSDKAGELAGTKVGDALTKVGNFVDDVHTGTILPGLEGDFSKGYTLGSWYVGDSATAKAARFVVKVGQDLAHASGMGMEAAAATYREVMERTHGDNDRATAMALVTLFAETGSEAFTVGNIHEAFAMGGDEAKRSFKNFVVEFFKNGAEEFFGEGINQYVEDHADEIIMGADSNYANRVKELESMGYSNSMAKEVASREMWKNVLEAAATGFLSSAMGMPTDYLRGYILGKIEESQQWKPSNWSWGENAIPGTAGALTGEEVKTSNRKTRTGRVGFKQGVGVSSDTILRNRNMVENWNRQIAERNAAAKEAGVSPALAEQDAQAVEKINAEKAAAETEEKQDMKDTTVLNGAWNSNPTGASIAVASVMNSGDKNRDKAVGQTFVGTMARNDPKVAAVAMQGILDNKGERSRQDVKETISQAALTKGKGYRALQAIVDKASSGKQITSEDVQAVEDGLKQDRSEDRDFDKKVQDAVRENRIANKTADILKNDERLNKAKEEASVAKKEAIKKERAVKQAEKDFNAEKQNAQDAIDQLATTGDKAANGPLQQTQNAMAAKLENLNKAKREALEANEKAEEAKKKKDEVEKQAMAEARAQATTEVHEEITQEQEAQAVQAVTESPVKPTEAFQKAITVNRVDADGNPTSETVQITGVFARLPDDVTIYTTTDGYVSSREIDEGGIPAELLDIYDGAMDKWYSATGTFKKNKNPIKPAVWLDHSVKLTDKQGVDIVGIAGKYDDNPVLMDSNGKLYLVDDVHMSPQDGMYIYDLFDSDDSIPELSVDDIYSGGAQAAETETQEEEATEAPAQEVQEEGAQETPTQENIGQEEQEAPVQEAQTQEAPESTEPVKMPEGFIAYPGGSATAIHNGETITVIGYNPVDGMYLLPEGEVVKVEDVYGEDSGLTIFASEQWNKAQAQAKYDKIPHGTVLYEGGPVEVGNDTIVGLYYDKENEMLWYVTDEGLFMDDDGLSEEVPPYFEDWANEVWKKYSSADSSVTKEDVEGYQPTYQDFEGAPHVLMAPGSFPSIDTPDGSTTIIGLGIKKGIWGEKIFLVDNNGDYVNPDIIDAATNINPYFVEWLNNGAWILYTDPNNSVSYSSYNDFNIFLSDYMSTSHDNASEQESTPADIWSTYKPEYMDYGTGNTAWKYISTPEPVNLTNKMGNPVSLIGFTTLGAPDNAKVAAVIQHKDGHLTRVKVQDLIGWTEPVAKWAVENLDSLSSTQMHKQAGATHLNEIKDFLGNIAGVDTTQQSQEQTVKPKTIYDLLDDPNYDITTVYNGGSGLSNYLMFPWNDPIKDLIDGQHADGFTFSSDGLPMVKMENGNVMSLAFVFGNGDTLDSWLDSHHDFRLWLKEKAIPSLKKNGLYEFGTNFDDSGVDFLFDYFKLDQLDMEGKSNVWENDVHYEEMHDVGPKYGGIYLPESKTIHYDFTDEDVSLLGFTYSPLTGRVLAVIQNDKGKVWREHVVDGDLKWSALPNNVLKWAIKNMDAISDNAGTSNTWYISHSEIKAGVDEAKQYLENILSGQSGTTQGSQSTDPYSLGKKNPKTGAPLQDWQDPPLHGKVKGISTKGKKLAKAVEDFFKSHSRWPSTTQEDVDPVLSTLPYPKGANFKKFFAKNAPEALPYVTYENGAPRLFFRGFGSFGKHLYTVHESSGSASKVDPEGNPYYINFYMSTLSTASKYAGTMKIAGLRDIVNWETAKAAMNDIGYDLVIAPNPNNPSQMGYQVMEIGSNGGLYTPTPNSKDGYEKRWFAENELKLFKNTYGGGLEAKGIHAGYIATKKPLILHENGRDWDNLVVHVVAPDGAHFDSNSASTDSLASWAFKHGYDSVILDDVQDDPYGHGESGVEIITKSSNMFQSAFNNGKYSENPDIMSKKSASPLKTKQNTSRKTPLTEVLGVDKLSDAFYNIMERFKNNESVPQEEVEALPEFQALNKMKTPGSSVSEEQFNAIRASGNNWKTAVYSVLPRNIAQRINVTKAVLDQNGSAVFDKQGNVTYTGEVRHDKRLDLMIGIPASGKSSIADYISAKYGSLMGDSDMAKEIILSLMHKRPIDEDYVHTESKVVNDIRLSEAAESGANVLFSVVGNDRDQVFDRIKPFLDAGYNIHLHYTDLSQNKALGRMLGRLGDASRFLNFRSVREIDPQTVLDTFNKMKEGGQLAGYARWNTDVAEKEHPVPVEFSDNAEIDIFNPGRNSNVANSVETGRKVNGNSTGNGIVGGQSSGLNTNQSNETPTSKYVKKLKGKLKSPQQIAQNLVKSLGFGNYLGSNNFGNLSKNTKGYWSRHAELLAVKNKYIGEYTDTMHEIGHGIAQKLGLVGNQFMIDNMIEDSRDENGYSVFESEYSPESLADEAMAEFMWRYMENEDRARAFSGDAFYDMFERELAKNPGMAKAVTEARGQLQRWINANDSERFQALVRHEVSGNRQNVREAIRTVINELADSSSIAEDVNAFVRQAQGVSKLAFSDDLRAQALLANHYQKRALMNLTDNLTDSDGNIVGDGFARMLDNAGFKGTEDNIHLLEEYALLKHSIDRDTQKKPVFGSMSKAEREARIKKIEESRPDIVRAEQAWQSFRHDFLQEWMVNTGYWTQEFLDHLEEIYPHYVPTFRVRDENSIMRALGGGRSAKRYTLHEATGGSQDIYSPYYSFIGMVDQITGMVATNKIAQTFDKLYQENEGMGIFGRQIPGGETTALEPNGELNAKQQQLMELLGDKIDNDLMEQVLDLTKSNYGVKQTRDSGLLKVQREDGTVVSYEIDNPELYKLLTGAHGSSGIKTLQIVGNLTRTMSMLTTGSNPLFAVRNAARDYQNSVNYGSWASNYLSGAPKWVKAFREVWRNSEDYQAYKALGGGGWTRIQQNNPKSMKEIQNEMFGDDKSTLGKTVKWAGKKLWDTITMERLNEVVEQASRFAEYKYGKHDLNSTEGRQEAFLAAQDVTVDFSRSGNSEAAYVLKKLVPFFNASMQGVYRTGRQFTEAERGTIARNDDGSVNVAESMENFRNSRVATRLTKTIVNSALASALAAGLILKFGDDDDKEEFMMLSDGVKANHLILPNPLKEQPGQPPFLRIPLAQDPATYAIHGIVTNAMMNGSDDEMAISLAATADVILDNLNPLGSGTIAQPLVDVSHNRTWYGSALVRNAQQDWQDPASQYNEDTPEIFKSLGRLINVSPEVVEYLASQYTGFIGAMAIPALSVNEDGSIGGFDAIMNSAIKKWTADPASSNDVTQEFYDMKKLVSTITSEAKADRAQNLLLRSLTQEQVNQAYDEAETMLKSGGMIYETNKLINDTYKKIDQINGNGSLSDDEKYKQTRDAKLEMLKQVQLVNENLAAYKKKYITGETLTDRVFGGIMKRTTEGKMAHIKTEIERLPDVFLSDVDSTGYMMMAQEVYNVTGKSSALPHPSQSFTAKDRNGVEQEYSIPDDEWDTYSTIYRNEYQNYMIRKSKGWETMSLDQRQNLLKAAHTKANKAMREQYIESLGRTRTPAEEDVVDDLGQYGAGNIDLHNRKVAHLPDGSIATVNSVSFNIDGKEVLLPTIIDGKQVSDDEAIDHYLRTGEYLGKFDTPEDASAYARHLHMVQQKLYGGR